MAVTERCDTLGYEYITDIARSSSIVRRRRVLLRRPSDWRQWSWFDFADLPHSLSHRRIPHDKELARRFSPALAMH
jgi:hypothetical protein